MDAAASLGLDSSLTKEAEPGQCCAGCRGCCSCEWLRTNAQGLGWKVDPWVILLGLMVSCAALAAGAIQVALRPRSASQKKGIEQVFAAAQMDDFAVLAMLMAAINVIPPVLFIIYCFTKGRLLRAAVWLGQALNFALFAGAVIALWLLIPPSHDLKKALELSSTFLQAQRATQVEAVPGSSATPSIYSILLLDDVKFTPTAQERYPWIPTGPTGSALDVVQGGFYMGGDFVKQSFPLASSLAMLAWSVLHYADAYEKAGVLQQLRGNLIVGAQYLMDCHKGPGQFVAQIGNPADYSISITAGTGYWGVPGNMPSNRTVLVVNGTQPGSRGAEVLAAASAALSAISAALTVLPGYFQSNLRIRILQTNFLSKATDLYREAQTMAPQANQAYEALNNLPPGTAKGSDTIGVQLFGSHSVFDDMAFAAGWLAVATGDGSLLAEGHQYLVQHWEQEAAWTEAKYYWPYNDHEMNMAWPAAVLLLTQQQQQQQTLGTGSNEAAALATKAWTDKHYNALSRLFQGWLVGRNAYTDVVGRTAKGFPWTDSGAPMPTAAAAGLLGLLWVAGEDAAAVATATSAAGGVSARRLGGAARDNMICWGLELTNHILGTGSRNDFSYLIGYGSSYPQKPQHRLSSCTGSATCSIATGLLSQSPNPTTLTGALVAGPAADGSYSDARTLSSQSSVGLHHNVPLIGLLGGLLTAGVTPGQCAAGHGLFQLYTAKLVP